ncbi:MAG TPA: hypothetical protein VN641_13000 [Urbifossiella sp.]|jgi:hypothetical protein|nr:hypothetical protein [Urbifossiella sp.]
MTALGKTLIFLNLILGIGAAVYSTSVYANRPPWFEDPESNIDKGNKPLYFKQLAADIDAGGKAGGFASAAWGTQLKNLESKEKLRSDRYVRMFGTLPDGTRAAGSKGLLDYAHEGKMPGAGAGGFVNLSEDPTTRLLDLNPDLKDVKNVIVHGPDGLPLKGTDSLLEQFEKDSLLAEQQANLSKKLRAQVEALGLRIGTVQTQVHKQREIRDNLVNEAAYLENFRVNATLNRETFQARRNQLLERLAPFRAQDKK